MASDKPIYILGAGAIGFPLAVQLVNAGRTVVAVRTSRHDLPACTTTVTVQTGAQRISAPVDTVSLAQLARIDGMVVITSKAYANPLLAGELAAKAARSPIVILQNGIGVEQPFLDAGFAEVYRCILYITSHPLAEHTFSAHAIAASPVGIVKGSAAGLYACVAALDTETFPFRAEANIQREIWKKAIINAVFNSICPLLDTDNGVFMRDAAVWAIAQEVVGECITLTERLGLEIGEQEVMEQIRRISRGTAGQLASTLQDMRGGRPTEIAVLNLAITRVAAELQPALHLPRTELLGRLIAAKSSANQ